jgi:lipocalin
MVAHILGDCPSYDSIVQPQGQKFDPEVYQGIWYEIATDEPTQPQFCQCAALNWTITSPTTFQVCGKFFPDGFLLASCFSDTP